MAENKTNTVDPKTGSITYQGPSVTTKGNHNSMPSRTSAYLPTDERGHIQASSLGGSNHRDNVVPMAKDLNHGSYLHMENAEKAAQKAGATVQSEKTAFVGNQTGGRPDAFLVNDNITFPSGNTQTVNLSFSNMQNDQQAGVNNETANLASDLMNEYANPNDSLRSTMTAEEYAELMEETDKSLPSIADYYTEWDYAGPPVSATETAASSAVWDGEAVADTTASNSGTTADPDDGVTADPDGSGPTEADGAEPDGGDGGPSASGDDE